MKRKAIITLMLVAIMAISTTVAYATDFTDNNGSLSSYGWKTTSGSFGGTFGAYSSLGSFGVYSNGTGNSIANYPLNLNPNGTQTFTLYTDFTINNLSDAFWVGVANSSSGATTGNQLMVGYPGSGSWATTVDGTSGTTQSMSSTAAPGNKTNYEAIISSSDGNTITFEIQDQNTGSVVAGPVSRTMPGGLAAYAVIWINNGATTAGAATSPEINEIRLEDGSGDSSTSTPTSTPTATPVPQSTANQAAIASIQAFYAAQPVVHMSNQSVIYYPNGSIGQVIGGNQAAATPIPTTTAVVTATPTTSAAVTATPTVVPPTATPVPTTQTKSPGFEIVLAAIGMLVALALVSRKK
jgi:hypothetical protein